MSQQYSEKFIAALALAAKWHQNHARKTGTPYISHLMTTSALVFEAGGSETEAIAALLHDAVEDVGVTLGEIEEHFGEEVTAIVFALTENKSLPKRDRKMHYLTYVNGGSTSVTLVSLCDKLHNGRCFLMEAERFATDKDVASRLWFFAELLKIYVDKLGFTPFVQEFFEVLCKLNQIWAKNIMGKEAITDDLWEVKKILKELQEASQYQSLIGKTLYNASGVKIGTITDIVCRYGIDCFEVGEIGKDVSPGRYWQVSRLNNGKSDAVSVSD